MLIIANDTRESFKRKFSNSYSLHCGPLNNRFPSYFLQEDSLLLFVHVAQPVLKFDNVTWCSQSQLYLIVILEHEAKVRMTLTEASSHSSGC